MDIIFQGEFLPIHSVAGMRMTADCVIIANNIQRLGMGPCNLPYQVKLKRANRRLPLICETQEAGSLVHPISDDYLRWHDHWKKTLQTIGHRHPNVAP